RIAFARRCSRYIIRRRSGLLLIDPEPCSRRGLRNMSQIDHADFGSISEDELFQRLRSGPKGLSAAEVLGRRKIGGESWTKQSRAIRALSVFAAQFRSPITLILIGATILSLALGDVVDAAIILAIILVGAGLGFWQEFSAANALESLTALVTARVHVLRDGV